MNVLMVVPALNHAIDVLCEVYNIRSSVCETTQVTRGLAADSSPNPSLAM